LKLGHVKTQVAYDSIITWCKFNCLNFYQQDLKRLLNWVQLLLDRLDFLEQLLF